MIPDKLHIRTMPTLTSPTLLLGFSGWMDGGEVSTGSIRYIAETLRAEKFAEIEPDGFYIQSFPGSMGLAALFRPHTRISNGLITSLEMSDNHFFYHKQSDLILFLGKEPNLNWRDFAECIFSLCARCGVKTIYFIGSVAGLVPHTREPTIFVSVSGKKLKQTFQQYGLHFTDYQGPASIVTYLTAQAPKRQMDMAAFVATVPAYVQGKNPRCVEAVTRLLTGILGLQIEIDKLRRVSDEFERKLTDIVQRQPELAEKVRQLEENYDKQVFDQEMGDLKQWLQQRGIRLD